jgi:uncharacterized protein YkwD
VSRSRKLSHPALRILLCASVIGALALIMSAAAWASTPRAGARAAGKGRTGRVRAPLACRRGHRCPSTLHKKSSKPARPHTKPPRKKGHANTVPAPSKPAVAIAAPPSAAATIAAVLASPCQNTELLPEAANIPLVRAAVLCLINRERANNGIAPLVPDAQLEAAAEGHCAELIADDYFAHVSPSGETPVDRIRTTGYIPSPDDGYVIGENLAWGTYELSTPKAIVAAWIASPEHLANILEGQYAQTGIGVTPAVPSSLADGAPGASYAQEFGVIIR